MALLLSGRLTGAIFPRVRNIKVLISVSWSFEPILTVCVLTLSISSLHSCDNCHNLIWTFMCERFSPISHLYLFMVIY